ncbi:hypothetical protein Ahy_A02g006665 isoform A [Arachis hypogaea]|uniref:Uncharacterized protein n=1 Tax=Arachis hypogaea TaxID=3818 RepID=A0A445EB27_ARAHY|nr:hypothetical protein Ahy_A02g006665 isoform A [Arachis hypogaea]
MLLYSSPTFILPQIHQPSFSAVAVALCCCHAAVAPIVAPLACTACRPAASAPPSLLLSVAAVAPPTLVLFRSLSIELTRISIYEHPKEFVISKTTCDMFNRNGGFKIIWNKARRVS